MYNRYEFYLFSLDFFFLKKISIIETRLIIKYIQWRSILHFSVLHIEVIYKNETIGNYMLPKNTPARNNWIINSVLNKFLLTILRENGLRLYEKLD